MKNDTPELAGKAAALTVTTFPVSFHTSEVAGVKIFYREAGDRGAPTVLLLHGFPTSSHMFRNLIPQLAGDFHIIAPDLPGFGFSDAPDHAAGYHRHRVKTRNPRVVSSNGGAPRDRPP
jgi:pimeloyl-ACP methyl ester carboxylesterase